MATFKRYQMWTRDGLVWSEWFKWTGQDRPKWQLKGKLLNEYKEE
jgi:hypothetical protein